MDSYVWDETLFAGTAPHYVIGRRPYPAELASGIRDALGLDGTGRLLDVGCGPGSLTTLLAPLFAAAVGVDADPAMISLAASTHPSIDWRCLRAEALPAGLGTFRVVAFAQSFHWMDQPAVARQVAPMIEPGGAWVHVGASTHRGDSSTVPWSAIEDLVRTYLGPLRRAGRSRLPADWARSGEDDVMRAAGFAGPVRITVPGGRPVTRSRDEVVSSVLSLSSSTPHLLGDRLPAFTGDLRALLSEPVYTEVTHEIEAVIWRPPADPGRSAGG